MRNKLGVLKSRGSTRDNSRAATARGKDNGIDGGNYPWSPYIVEPSVVPKSKTTNAPLEKLLLDRVYGYSTKHGIKNCHYLNRKEIVYPISSLAVVFQMDSSNQIIYGSSEEEGLGHDNTVTAVAVHPNKKIIASGQAGRPPSIHLWSLADGRALTQIILKQHHSSSHVACLRFSPDGKYLISGGVGSENYIHVYDWADGKTVVQESTGEGKPIDLTWGRAHKSDTFAVISEESHVLYKLDSIGKKSSKDVYKNKNSGVETTSGDFGEEDILYLGNIKGAITAWKNGSVFKNSNVVHSGGLTCLLTEAEFIYTCGEDKTVKKLSSKFDTLSQTTTQDVPISLDLNTRYRKFLVGMRSGYIMQYDTNSTDFNALVIGHGEETWGLVADPTNPEIFVTASDDGKLLVWNIEKEECVSVFTCNEEPTNNAANKRIKRAKKKPKKKVKGEVEVDIPPPTSESKLPYGEQGRALDINIVNGHVSVALNNGEVSIRESTKALGRLVAILNDCESWIPNLKSSPDGSKLVVCCADNHIYIYNSSSPLYPMLTKLPTQSPVYSLDFTTSSEVVRTQTTTQQIFYFSISSSVSSQVEDGPTRFRDESWYSHSCSLIWPAQGLLQAGLLDYMSYMATNLTNRLFSVAIANGEVRLYRCPCPSNAGYKSVFVHVGKVRRVAWNADSLFVMTVGGNDQAVIQWRMG